MSVHVRLLDALEYCAFLLFLVWKLTNSMRSRHEEISVMSVSESLEENRIFDVDVCLVCIWNFPKLHIVQSLNSS